ncbi:MAG: hypothetical protein Q8Q80_04205 [Methyloversatilis sp.]|uniref:hypothetical protein n=1 Tax=Methyloversatilis sp. TaxID=2569862 RepID=UPI0027329FCC|nr:hypothetical protein [Methyloversatilis sp.]MDP3871844.1 hypothetical protein [Methyloversatilis sp.]
MTSPNLRNLVGPGKLKAEAPNEREFDGLVRSAAARLRDAHNDGLSIESRFDLAYNAAHALSLAALRRAGYRSDNRYLVFQCLPHTLGAGPEVWRVLDNCHNRRNRSEYEGVVDMEATLLDALLKAADWLLETVSQLRA